MKRESLHILGLILLLSAMRLHAQEDQKKWTLDGYLTFMNTNTIEDFSKEWVVDNQLHNRLNATWYPSASLTFSAQLRNRLMYGGSLTLNPMYADPFDVDRGVIDLSANLISEKSVLLNSTLDRLNLLWQKGDWELQVGRQRINWGRTLVWNPNDIFNSYSFFDFDYEEKPGSDALRIQYYLNYASSLELAASVNADEKLSLALKYAFNKWNYDFQLIAGEVGQKDAVAAFGWAGQIAQLGFKGEASYFMPLDASDSSDQVFVATASLDYTFKNSLSLLAQAMYSDVPENSPVLDFQSYYSGQLNAKYLSFETWNYFLQAEYPISPLLSFSLSGIYYPQMRGYFIHPGIRYSLAENLSFALIGQYFNGRLQDPQTQILTDFDLSFIFLRLKWSF